MPNTLEARVAGALTNVRNSRVDNDLYFICADFKTPKGRIYDLDFWMRGTSQDGLRLTQAITIHKEEGRPRYYWSFDRVAGVWKQKPEPERKNRKRLLRQ